MFSMFNCVHAYSLQIYAFVSVIVWCVCIYKCAFLCVHDPDMQGGITPYCMEEGVRGKSEKGRGKVKSEGEEQGEECE